MKNSKKYSLTINTLFNDEGGYIEIKKENNPQNKNSIAKNKILSNKEKYLDIKEKKELEGKNNDIKNAYNTNMISLDSGNKLIKIGDIEYKNLENYFLNSKSLKDYNIKSLKMNPQNWHIDLDKSYITYKHNLNFSISQECSLNKFMEIVLNAGDNSIIIKDLRPDLENEESERRRQKYEKNFFLSSLLISYVYGFVHYLSFIDDDKSILKLFATTFSIGSIALVVILLSELSFSTIYMIVSDMITFSTKEQKIKTYFMRNGKKFIKVEDMDWEKRNI